ncbi:MAG: hypothetical protein BWY85_00876 [Firmicutes bacterium ADurb.Bin506]|nr:MAG: hypothetical protein BWY85_00876 [Firmicutes bacterium ADurb.Bin506]
MVYETAHLIAERTGSDDSEPGAGPGRQHEGHGLHQHLNSLLVNQPAHKHDDLVFGRKAQGFEA